MLHQMLELKPKHVVYNVLMQPYDIVVTDSVFPLFPTKKMSLSRA
jgi:hypothetical protein